MIGKKEMQNAGSHRNGEARKSSPSEKNLRIHSII